MGGTSAVSSSYAHAEAPATGAPLVPLRTPHAREATRKRKGAMAIETPCEVSRCIRRPSGHPRASKHDPHTASCSDDSAKRSSVAFAVPDDVLALVKGLTETSWLAPEFASPKK